ncbi:MAG: bifunctional folylpolyglutamate synthase/dihydrofolate synthase [Pseudobutyrivibrio sp.]|nr:bifunctional folylpolyglutamate synthase/dihydrofolate synthase [Pseudobutyrivibrio sp.]
MVAELALLEQLNNPQNDLKYIHVAGTNGKGSTVGYIASITEAAGIKTGRFTSPFLHTYNEMFMVDGKMISNETFARLFSIVKPYYDKLTKENIFPSEYEILISMAFLYFKEMECQLVVLEVAMGGRVDVTNVIPSPMVTVFTPISYDHMSILGHTLSEIATEKAGIIKSGTVVVTASQEPEVKNVLEAFSSKNGVGIVFAGKAKATDFDLSGQSFSYEGRKYFTSMLGNYQIENAAVALKVAEVLNDLGYSISPENMLQGISNMRWFGRFTLLSNDPPVIIDGGHNRQGARVLRESLEKYFPNTEITFVLGILEDKEIDIMLAELMPIAKRVYTIAVPSPRTMQPEKLAELIRNYEVEAIAIKNKFDLKEIYNDSQCICIAGSLYLIDKFTNQIKIC